MEAKDKIKVGLYFTNAQAQVLGEERFNAFRAYLRRNGFQVRELYGVFEAKAAVDGRIYRIDSAGDLIKSTMDYLTKWVDGPTYRITAEEIISLLKDEAKGKLKAGLYLTQETAQKLGKERFDAFREYLQATGFRVSKVFGQYTDRSLYTDVIYRLDDDGDLVRSSLSYCRGKYEITEEEILSFIEEKSMVAFGKKDLVTGDILVFNDDTFGQVLLGTKNGDIVAGKDVWLPLDSYSDEVLFVERDRYAFVKSVWRPKDNMHFHQGRFTTQGGGGYTKCWERKEKTKEEIALEGVEASIAELQEKAKELRAAITKEV